MGDAESLTYYVYLSNDPEAGFTYLRYWENNPDPISYNAESATGTPEQKRAQLRLATEYTMTLWPHNAVVQHCAIILLLMCHKGNYYANASYNG